MFDIQEELRKLPDQPGVYIMHDKTDAIIYIGKAVSLRKRVRQYFQPSHDEGIKKKQMVEHIARFEYIITDSELEALVLECNLIKEHTPKYNTMLRDDKTYPYIRVTMGEDFPRVLFSRQLKKDKSRYFGPYTSAGAVKDTIELIQEEKHFLKHELTKIFGDQMKIFPSEANFLLLKTQIPLYRLLLERGILIRNCANYTGLGQDFYRIAVKGHPENVQLIEALLDIKKKGEEKRYGKH